MHVDGRACTHIGGPPPSALYVAAGRLLYRCTVELSRMTKSCCCCHKTTSLPMHDVEAAARCGWRRHAGT